MDIATVKDQDILKKYNLTLEAKGKDQGIFKEYNLTFHTKELEPEIEAELENIRASVKMEGFRPGKVPLSIVKNKYYDEIRQKKIIMVVEKAIEEHVADQTILGKVNVGDIDFAADPISVSFNYTLPPEIADLDYSNLELEKLICDLDADEITQNIELLKKQFRNFTESDKAADLEDKLTIDFLGTIDGKPFAGGQANNATIVLGSKQFIEGFEEGLIGAKAGEKRDLHLTFPENYHSEQAGKKATFKVTVHKVEAAEAVPSDAELADRLGKDDIEAVQELVRSHLNEQLEQMSKVFLRKSLFDKLDEIYHIELPSELIQQESKALHANANHQHDENCNHDAEYNSLATRRVKLGLILSEFAKKAEITVTQQDIKEAIYTHANSFPGREHEVMQFFRSNEAARENLKGPILEDKVVDYILERVKYTERHISMSELQALYNSIK